MAQVIVELNGKEVARESLKGPNLVIGRDASVDIPLDNRALSRRHAQIEKRGAAIWIRDLGSQNGTFVNGQRMDEPQPLNGGDVIEVGRYQLHIEGVDEARADTPVLTLTGPEGKHRFAMVGDEIIIGRAPSCDIAIGHKSISRRHLRIALDGDVFFAEDLGSQNGTKINGIRTNGPTEFQLGDEIQMSEFSVEVGFLESDGEGPESERGGGNTMMIDRSELAKAAYVDGDFERMRSSAGRLAMGHGSDGEGQKGGTGEFDLDGKDDETRGLPQAPSTKKNVSKNASKRKSTGIAPAMQPSDQPSSAGNAYDDEEAGPEEEIPWIMLSHPGLDDREVDLEETVSVFGEDGTMGCASDGRSYAAQGYLVLTTTGHGVSATVAGDRRLVTVNGKPQLFAELSEGDTVEFGLLTVIFHSS